MEIKDYLVGKFKDTGYNKLDVEALIRDWDLRYVLSEWRSGNEWTLAIYARKDTFNRLSKIKLAPKQAKKLIKKMGLESERVFGTAFEWRTRKDRYNFQQYKLNKHNGFKK